MLDIETMGNGPQSAILSIGAADFDSDRLFYCNVDLQSCLDAGLKVDGSTIMWWLAQSEEARGALGKDAKPLKEALLDFTKWLSPSDARGFYLVYEGELWAYPASFDLVIVENACRAVGFNQPPWHYRAPRCLRTIAATAGVPKPKATPHEACRDAQMQVEWAKACLKALGKE
jgi:exodeoxyribonuclease VIII